jgi:hypothetical protein
MVRGKPKAMATFRPAARPARVGIRSQRRIVRMARTVRLSRSTYTIRRGRGESPANYCLNLRKASCARMRLMLQTQLHRRCHTVTDSRSDASIPSAFPAISRLRVAPPVRLAVCYNRL